MKNEWLSKGSNDSLLKPIHIVAGLRVVTYVEVFECLALEYQELVPKAHVERRRTE